MKQYMEDLRKGGAHYAAMMLEKREMQDRRRQAVLNNFLYSILLLIAIGVLFLFLYVSAQIVMTWVK